MAEELLRQSASFPDNADRARQVIVIDGQEVVPRQWGDKDAVSFAELLSIENDLLHVVSCCDSLIDRETSQFQKKVTEDSALIHYRRCFNSGLRSSLRFDDLDLISRDDKELHRDIISIVDKHIAHSVNELEVFVPVVVVPPDSEAEPFFAGMTVRANSHGERIVVGLKGLATRFLAVVNSRKTVFEDLCAEKLKKLSREEMLNFPEFDMSVNIRGEKLKKPRKKL